MHGTIHIEIDHDVETDRYIIEAKTSASPNMVMAACANILVRYEMILPKSSRADFRSDFLEVLNDRRREVIK